VETVPTIAFRIPCPDGEYSVVQRYLLHEKKLDVFVDSADGGECLVLVKMTRGGTREQIIAAVLASYPDAELVDGEEAGVRGA
jgi:hypothetical protein